MAVISSSVIVKNQGDKVKEIIGFDNKYKVDDEGNVWSFKNNNVRKLKPAPDKDGYLKVLLCKDGKETTHYNHRLVAKFYLQHDTKDLVIDHINRDKSDNRIENLRLVTSAQNSWNTNAKGAYKIGTTTKWFSSIHVNGKQIYLGTFDTSDLAHSAYLKAKELYHVI